MTASLGTWISRDLRARGARAVNKTCYRVTLMLTLAAPGAVVHTCAYSLHACVRPLLTQ